MTYQPTIPEPTTEIRRGATAMFTQETWTVGPYRLVRQYSATTPGSNWRVYAANHSVPEVYNKNGALDPTVEYGVNWPAKGTKSAAETYEFAMYLMQAAHAADIFTAIRTQNPDHE